MIDTSDELCLLLLELIWPPPFTADRQAGFPGKGGWTLCLTTFGAILCFWQKQSSRVQPPPAPFSQLFAKGKLQGNSFPGVRWRHGKEALSPAPAAGAPLKSHFFGETWMNMSVHFYTWLMQIAIQPQDREERLNNTLCVALSPISSSLFLCLLPSLCTFVWLIHLFIKFPAWKRKQEKLSSINTGDISHS